MSPRLCDDQAMRPATTWSVLLLCFLAAGCNPYQTPRSWPNAQIGPEFEAGADRPPTAKTLYALSRMLAAQGQDRECEFILMRVILQHPDFLPAYCDLAELHVRHRRVEEATRILEAGLERSPKDPVLLNDLGMCRMIKGEYQRALGFFSRAAMSVPHDARYRANMAAALGMLGRYEESLALYKQVLPPSRAHYNLAILCEARKDSARAAVEFERAQVLAGEPPITVPPAKSPGK